VKPDLDTLAWWEIFGLFLAGLWIVPTSIKLGDLVIDLIGQWRNDRALQRAIDDFKSLAPHLDP